MNKETLNKRMKTETRNKNIHLNYKIFVLS